MTGVQATRYLVAVLVAVAYSLWLARTHPFTTGAKLVTAVGFILVTVLALPRIPELRHGRYGRRNDSDGSARIWVIAIGLLVLVELCSYFAGFAYGRPEFPTMSSLYDSTQESVPAKAFFVFVWLTIGWGLFRPTGATGGREA